MIKGGKKLLNPLVAAQNFEYKVSFAIGTTNQGIDWAVAFSLDEQYLGQAT